MIQRLRHGVARLFSRPRAQLRRKRRGTYPPVKGHMANIIVVKPPDPRFKEAVFVLKDDYFSDAELSRQELLLQAKDAACEYIASISPPRRRSPLLPVIAFAAVALALAIFILTKVL